MVWWIAAKILAPFAKGALGSVVKLALFGGIVVASMIVVGLDPVAIGTSLLSSAIDAAVDAVADALADRVGF